ncbi:MAG: signal peptidase II [Verrucomicrobiae bacterium]|nr:signal peptidase II [Verrucomicrobiae bacterium]
MTQKGDSRKLDSITNFLKPGEIITIVCVIVAFLDQISKLAVIELLSLHEDRVIIDGFFKLVYWGNTGAAWSLFRDNNELLTVISLLALLFLFIVRDKFETSTLSGQAAMGMIFGGIIGNIVDRLIRGHVVDFLYFYVIQRSGNELGFPAFNLADLSICLGVAVMIILIITKKEFEETPIHMKKGDSPKVDDSKMTVFPNRSVCGESSEKQDGESQK